MKKKIILFAALLVGMTAFAVEPGLQAVYTIPAQGGEITFSPDPYTTTTATFTITATPNTADGYEFLKWADGDNTNPRTVSPTDDIVYKAIFVKTDLLNYAEGTVSVAVKDAGTAITPMTYSLTFNPAGYNSFTEWNNGETALTTDYLVADGKVVPVFGKNLLNEITDGGCGTITFEPTTGGYILTAVPDEGYYLVQWEDGTNTNPRTVGHEEKIYTASFAQIPTGSIQGQNGSYATFADAFAANETNLKLLSELTEDVTLPAGKTITIDGNNQTILGDMTVDYGTTLNVTSALTLNNLYLNATTGISSQLMGENNITAQMWIDIKLEANQTTASDAKWYAISVPFEVDINSGVYHNDGTKATNITDYLAWEYNGTLRASYTGMDGNGWEKMNKATGTMTAGRFYMFGINGSDNVWRFKKTGAFGSTSVSLSEFPAGDDINKGWNAVGNSTLLYSKATITDINYAQVYDNGDAAGRYIPKSLSNTTFVMACPFFVQTSANGTMTLTANNETDPGKRYLVWNADPSCELHLNNAEGKNIDALFLTTSENAENRYVIGKDVAKLMGNANGAYIWANGYGQRLCAQDTRMEDGVALFSVSIYAPAAGTYRLQAFADATDEIWLLQGEERLANLAEDDYELYLTKGTSDYIVQFGSPRTMPTDLNVIGVDGKVLKVIRDNHLMIYINNRIFDAQGKQLK
ncbi:MAG: hypothetical protein KBS40_04135 [Bacteroidales bacterium]|nr:hypothetical protein [Bacteroidales bacterium]